jgi:hypothetical protein
MILKKKNSGLKRLIIGQTLFEPPVLEVYDLDSDSEHEA